MILVQWKNNKYLTTIDFFEMRCVVFEKFIKFTIEKLYLSFTPYYFHSLSIMLVHSHAHSNKTNKSQ